MQKYSFNLLILLLGTSLTCIITPCHAQTPVKSNNPNTENISSISSNSPSAVQLPNLANSTHSKATILSEAVNKSSASKANIATQPQPRIPIFSRIFRTSSMQQ